MVVVDRLPAETRVNAHVAARINMTEGTHAQQETLFAIDATAEGILAPDATLRQ